MRWTSVLVLGVIAFALWRNYGVVAKGDSVDLSNPKTNEQKELAEKVKDTKESVVRTSFGVYQNQENKWVKIKEIWD